MAHHIGVVIQCLVQVAHLLIQVGDLGSHGLFAIDDQLTKPLEEVQFVIFPFIRGSKGCLMPDIHNGVFLLHKILVLAAPLHDFLRLFDPLFILHRSLSEPKDGTFMGHFHIEPSNTGKAIEIQLELFPIIQDKFMIAKNKVLRQGGNLILDTQNFAQAYIDIVGIQ